MKTRFLIFAKLIVFSSFAQFPGPVGNPGTTAIYKDSSAFVAWAKQCHVTRGLEDISTPSLGVTTAGDSSMAIGKSDGSTVSLGDAGYAILTFSAPIMNGAGYDFAVFENAFNDTFLELGFVEVSSDGVNFFRFPATSNSPTSPQYDNSAVIDASKLDNLGGKYRILYGTPFDLQQLTGNPQLNINAVTHVKIIDVVGSINPLYARYDKNNNIINDPWPTPFPSGGFDLDAVGVINQTVGIQEMQDDPYFSVYPNPFHTLLNIRCSDFNKEGGCRIKITNTLGELILETQLNSYDLRLNVTDFNLGIYFITLESKNHTITRKLIRN
jgi:hypothetical protein